MRGLLALGGIDFGATAIAAGKPDSVFLTAASGQDLSGAITRTAESFGSFGPLKASGVLPKRWIVERTLAWISRCRRLARNLENLARTSLALIRLAMIKLMARRLTRQ